MTGLGFAAAAGVVTAGLAAAALVVFGVAVASAAFFFVGIVAFRSVGAAAFAAAALVDVEVFVGAVPAVTAFGPVAPALACVGLATAVLVVGFGATFVVLALALPVGLEFVAAFIAGLARLAEVLAAVRAFDAAKFFAAARPDVVALAAAAVALVRDSELDVALVRLTEAAGCAALRAAALDAAAGLAVTDFPEGFVALRRSLDPADADVFAFGAAAVAAGFLATLFAALRSRATGLVLGDMSATPGSDGHTGRDRYWHAWRIDGHVKITPIPNGAV